MAKARRVYLCRSCGSVHPRWMGKCPDCGTWDALEETTLDPLTSQDPHKGLAVAAADIQGGSGLSGPDPASGARALSEINEAAAPMPRLSTGIGEFDRVLGGGANSGSSDGMGSTGGTGGLVPGSAVLLGGEPGIGKSTLLLQAAFALASRGTRVLYVSSEESAEQVAMRGKRLRDEDLKGGENLDRALFILADTNLARIVEQTRKVGPRVLMIDSIQMIYKPDVPASPGSVTQLRRCCAELVYLAKASGVAIVLVGHVTKDGTLAGPRLLEHLVDCVLSFEGDRYHAHRVVRAVKNRFGTTLELGLFEMTSKGLEQVPEGAGLPAASAATGPGSVVCPVMSGTRCMLVELQALTATGFLGAAKRKSSGLDANRLAMIIAVLEQHAGLRLADRDVFASAVGGVRVSEPASDLALLLAIAGAHFKRALPPATCVLGEVGLSGEIRAVPHMEQRLREAVRLGYTHALAPRGKLPRIPGLTLVQASKVSEAMDKMG